MNLLYIGGAVAAILVVIAIVRYPLFGFLLIVVQSPIDYLIAEKTSLSFGRVLGVVTALGWLASVVVNRRTRMLKHWPVNLLVLSLATVMVASTLVSREPEYGMRYVITLSLLMVLALFIQDFIGDRMDLQRLIWVIALTMGLSSLVGLVQYREIVAGETAMGTVDTIVGGYRMGGTRTNANGYGMMLMSGLPFLVFLAQTARGTWTRMLLAGLVLTSILSIFLTVSRTQVTSMFAFFLALLFVRFAYLRGRLGTVLVFSGVVTLLATIYFLLPDYVFNRLIGATFAVDTSTRIRMGFLSKAIDLVVDHPLFGIGVGNFGFYGPLRGMDPHDTVSFLLSSIGLVGSGVFVGIVLTTLVKMSGNIRAFRSRGDYHLTNLSITLLAAFLALLVAGFGTLIVFQRVFWIYVALAAVLSKAEAYGLAASPPADGRVPCGAPPGGPR